MTYTPTIVIVAGPDADARFAAAVGNYPADESTRVATTAAEVRNALRRDVTYVAVPHPDVECLEQLAHASLCGVGVLVQLDADYTDAAAWVRSSLNDPTEADIQVRPLGPDNVHRFGA